MPPRVRKHAGGVAITTQPVVKENAVMTQRRVAPNPRTTNADPDLLVTVSTVCARAGDVMRALKAGVAGGAT